METKENDTVSEQEQKPVFCPCCGLVEQNEILSSKVDIGMVNHIGVSTMLYFMTIKVLILLEIIMLLVFGVYALYSNKAAAMEY